MSNLREFLAFLILAQCINSADLNNNNANNTSLHQPATLLQLAAYATLKNPKFEQDILNLPPKHPVIAHLLQSIVQRTQWSAIACITCELNKYAIQFTVPDETDPLFKGVVQHYIDQYYKDIECAYFIINNKNIIEVNTKTLSKRIINLSKYATLIRHGYVLNKSGETHLFISDLFGVWKFSLCDNQNHVIARKISKYSGELSLSDSLKKIICQESNSIQIFDIDDIEGSTQYLHEGDFRFIPRRDDWFIGIHKNCLKLFNTSQKEPIYSIILETDVHTFPGYILMIPLAKFPEKDILVCKTKNSELAYSINLLALINKYQLLWYLNKINNDAKSKTIVIDLKAENNC
jgi:hypothetical protein